MASSLSQSAILATGIFIGVASTRFYSDYHSSQPTQPTPTTTNTPSSSLTRQFHFNLEPNPEPILKFGHPGQFLHHSHHQNHTHNHSIHSSYLNLGPLNDFFNRQAYAMAFDRRMRNPAWTAEHLTSTNLRPQPGGDQPDRSHSSVFSFHLS